MNGGTWRDWTWCGNCGKRLYGSKKAAKQAIRIVPGQRMNAYECPAAPGYHVGHLPGVVRRGETSRAEYYADCRVTNPSALAGLAVWIVTRCEVGRTFLRARPACDRAPDYEITRHDCEARPPFRTESYICGLHLEELAAMAYPFVACRRCGRTFPTFGHAIASIRPVR